MSCDRALKKFAIVYSFFAVGFFAVQAKRRWNSARRASRRSAIRRNSEDVSSEEPW